MGYIYTRYDCHSCVTPKCKLNNADRAIPQKPYSGHSEQRNSKQKIQWGKQRELEKNGKVRIRLNIDVAKEKEDSRLNAIKTKIAFVEDRLNN